MRSRHLLTTAAMTIMLFCVAPTGSAQKYYVSPPAYTSVEASSRNSYPLKYAVCRFQTIYTATALGFKGGMINEFSFRRDGTYTTPCGPNKLTTKIWLSICPRDAMSASYTWANNRGKTPALVFSGTLNVPSCTIPATAPCPWAAPYMTTITFSKPWLYTGGNICIEFENNGTGSNVAWMSDAFYNPESASGSRTYVYPPGATANTCIPPGGKASKLSVSSYQCFIGKENYYSHYTYQPSTANILAVGVNDKTFGSAGLPFDLKLLGAPGCWIFNDIVFTMAKVSSTSSTSSYSKYYLNVPNVQALVNASIYIQGYTPLKTANALGLMTSGGCKIVFGPPSAAYSVQSFFTTNINSATGSSSSGANGHITRFGGALY